MTAPSRLERKQAAKQALALVTAAMQDDPQVDLVTQLREVDDIVLVVSSLVGLSTGLLRSFDDLRPGASARWLAGIGLSLESMTGDEA